MARRPSTAPHDESTPPTEDEDAPVNDPTESERSSNRFFTWLRVIDLPRQPGWIGGVCAGIAARLGIDPLIVRGIFVVVAVLGGPVFLLYAAAWLLLPDTNGRIHLEDVTRGRIESPIAGIAVIFALSFLPLAQGFWFAGAAFWGEPSWWPALGRTLWTLLLLGLTIAFIVWVARRAHSSTVSEPVVVPATTDDQPETVPDSSAAASDVALTLSTTPQVAEPAPPPVLPLAASADQLADWRAAQEQWKAEHKAWKTASNQELKTRLAAESRERAIAATAVSAERSRLRRLANPRIPAAAGWLVIGVAVIAAALVGFTASASAALSPFTTPIALATVAFVLGLAIAVSGALRRRSGWLSFLSVLVVGAMLGTAMIPSDRELLSVNAGVNGGSGGYAQVAGSLYVDVRPDLPVSGVTDVWQGTGDLRIDVAEGAAARIEIVSRTGTVNLWTFEPLGDEVYQFAHSFPDTLEERGNVWRGTVSVGAEGVEPQIVRIFQGLGQIDIYDNTPPPALEETER